MIRNCANYLLTVPILNCLIPRKINFIIKCICSPTWFIITQVYKIRKLSCKAPNFLCCIHTIMWLCSQRKAVRRQLRSLWFNKLVSMEPWNNSIIVLIKRNSRKLIISLFPLLQPNQSILIYKRSYGYQERE